MSKAPAAHDIKATEGLKCGIIMPIASIDGCDADHWLDVLNIIKDSLAGTQFVGELVSNSLDTGVIQGRIVQNLYENPIAICDVSAKNPNVMFELGMRLAFDKPTVIIKDSATGYSFDTSIIEHLEYPRDLRFKKIVSFQEELKNKVIATYEASRKPESSSFLRHFKVYKAKELPSEEVTGVQAILKSIEALRADMNQIRQDTPQFKSGPPLRPDFTLRFVCGDNVFYGFRDWVKDRFPNVRIRSTSSSTGKREFGVQNVTYEDVQAMADCAKQLGAEKLSILRNSLI